MKKKPQISKDEAMILLQSQPLSANLWRIVSDQPGANFIRFPDASFIDSQTWPAYISKKHKTKLIEQTSVEEVFHEVAKENAQRIEDDKAENKIENSPSKLKEPLFKEIIQPEFVEDINNSESQLYEVKLEEVDSEVVMQDVKIENEIEGTSKSPYETVTEEINQLEIVSEISDRESHPVDMKVEEKVKDMHPDDEISLPVNPPKRKRAISNINTQPEREMEPIYSDSPGPEAREEKFKSTTKSLDFYEWLEELKQPGTSELKKPRARKVKPKTVDKDLEETKMIAENSLKLGEEIVSETLARLLARQGHREEAIEMYQKLILKYPEKEATFAAALQKLKS